MGRESNLWKSNLKPHLDRTDDKIFYQRIEDALSCGIPDVYLSVHGKGGWYELKYLKAFPSRLMTNVRLDYRANQYTWGSLYKRSGGIYGLITQVGRDYFLHDDLEVLNLISKGSLVKDEFINLATIQASPSREFVEEWIEYHKEQCNDQEGWLFNTKLERLENDI